LAIDPIELGKWQRGETECGRARRMAAGLWHNFVPNLFGWKISPLRLLFGVIRGLCVTAIALAPIWLKFYENTSRLSWTEAAVYSIIIAVMLIYGYWYDKIVKELKPRSISHKLREKLTLETSGITKRLNQVVKLRLKDLKPELESAESDVLKCIRNASRIHLKDFEGTCIEATLFLFNEADCESIKIASRTTSSRPAGQVFPCADVMAYHVAKSGKHRVVHDFMKDDHPFPKLGLSGGGTPSYRSILLMPLLDRTDGGSDTCIGVVTVDSTRPYHFWPGNGEDLVLRLKSYCTFLALFLNLKEPHRLRY